MNFSAALILVSAVAAAGQTSSAPGVTMKDPPSSGHCKIIGSHTTTIRLTVTPSGRPVDEFVDVSSGDKCLDQQALQTVAGYHFNPAIKNGQPVATHIRLQVNYKQQ
ncbi:MAG: energy transducer TonB [Janthinobacterium lividum]